MNNAYHLKLFTLFVQTGCRRVFRYKHNISIESNVLKLNVDNDGDSPFNVNNIVRPLSFYMPCDTEYVFSLCLNTVLATVLSQLIYNSKIIFETCILSS